MVLYIEVINGTQSYVFPDLVQRYIDLTQVGYAAKEDEDCKCLPC